MTLSLSSFINPHILLRSLSAPTIPYPTSPNAPEQNPFLPPAPTPEAPPTPWPPPQPITPLPPYRPPAFPPRQPGEFGRPFVPHRASFLSRNSFFNPVLSNLRLGDLIVRLDPEEEKTAPIEELPRTDPALVPNAETNPPFDADLENILWNHSPYFFGAQDPAREEVPEEDADRPYDLPFTDIIAFDLNRFNEEYPWALPATGALILVGIVIAPPPLKVALARAALLYLE